MDSSSVTSATQQQKRHWILSVCDLGGNPIFIKTKKTAVIYYLIPIVRETNLVRVSILEKNNHFRCQSCARVRDCVIFIQLVLGENQRPPARRKPAVRCCFFFSFLSSLYLHHPQNICPLSRVSGSKISPHLQDTVDGDKLPSSPTEGAFKEPLVISPKR